MAKVRFLAIGFLMLGVFAGYFNLAPFLFENSLFTKFPFHLGLDLQGGSHLVYEADTSALADSNEIDESMAGLRDVIERRVNLFGVAEPVVQIEKRDNSNRLIIELAGIKDTNQAIEMIGQTPFLEFRTQSITEPELGNAVPKLNLETAFPSSADSEGLEQETITFIPSPLTGRYLKRAVLDFDQTTYAPVINLEFNNEGKDLFAALTRENVGKPVAIFLDGEPISIPIVREEIPSGQAQITGQFTPDEARTLVRRLNSGALPVPIKLISQQSVGASLGEEALAKGVKAGIFGIIAVMLFLMYWYRLPGVLGSAALAIYIGIVLIIFKLLPVTLTAAGIAGFILSAGMAVDASILIFERFKEEFRGGGSLEGSLKEGFNRAWTSIRDSNFSTLITSAILYWFGTSVVRGFALTLGLGILVSIFTALTVTRVFLFSMKFNEEKKIVKFLFGTGFK